MLDEIDHIVQFQDADGDFESSDASDEGEDSNSASMAQPAQVLDAVTLEAAGLTVLVLSGRIIASGLSLDSVWNIHWTAHLMLLVCFVTTAVVSIFPQSVRKPGLMFYISFLMVMPLFCMCVLLL